MIEPALFALIRDGQTTWYLDPCGSQMLIRNLVWGPEALEHWLQQHDAFDEWDSEEQEIVAGVVVDFDAQAMLWYADDGLQHARSCRLADRLIETAWSGFEILYSNTGIADVLLAAGLAGARPEHRVLVDVQADVDSDFDPLAGRCETVEEQAEYDEDLDPDDEDERFAWITIVDDDNCVHHRLLGETPVDVIYNRGPTLAQLLDLSSAEIPAEINVTEALLFDMANQTIRVWGGRHVAALETALQGSWVGWTVTLQQGDGYGEQCRISGPVGAPMSDAEALGSVLPVLLSTKRIDASMILGELGKSLKGCAIRIVATVTGLICLPFLIFALVTGNWKATGITVLVIIAIVTILFKVLERRWKRGFAKTMADRNVLSDPIESSHPVVVGPTDGKKRRRELDDLLRKAGMPTVAEVEPFFDSDLSPIA
jgi:hypothetical protein